MPFWNRNKQRQSNYSSAELAEVQGVFRDLMARDKVEGPGVRPWRERRTTKPYPDYRAAQWDNWAFNTLPGANYLIVPERLIGQVFPDDLLLVNGEFRKVVNVFLHFDHPVIEVEPSKPTATPCDDCSSLVEGLLYWDDLVFGGPADRVVLTMATALHDGIEDVRAGDYVVYNQEWRQVLQAVSHGERATILIDLVPHARAWS